MYLCCTYRLIPTTIPGLLLPCPHTVPPCLIVSPATPTDQNQSRESYTLGRSTRRPGSEKGSVQVSVFPPPTHSIHALISSEPNSLVSKPPVPTGNRFDRIDRSNKAHGLLPVFLACQSTHELGQGGVLEDHETPL